MPQETAWFPDWSPQKLLLALLTVLVCSTLFICASVLRRRWRRFRLHARWERARAAEGAAPALLRAQGFELVGAQVEGGYAIIVDDQRLWIPLRADFIVKRGSHTYVAEVKSGRLAPRLQTSATRRQLLEYLVAYEVDGVLLVNPEQREIHEVVFPMNSTREHHEDVSTPAPILVGVAILLCILLAFLLR